MKQDNLGIKLLLLIALAFLTLQLKSQPNCGREKKIKFTADFAAGVMTGRNNLTTGYKLRDSLPFQVYDDIKEWQRTTSGAAYFSIGLIVKDRLHIITGITTGIDRVQPVFFNLNSGYIFFDPEAVFRIMPYLGVSYRSRNIEQQDFGWTYSKGVQLTYWLDFVNHERQAIILTADHTFKHASVTIGIKSVF